MDASDSGSAGSGYSMIGTNRPSPGSTRVGPVQSGPENRPSRAPVEESAPMEQLAATTGGIHFHSGGDLAKQLRAAIADGRAYYTIAYTPRNGVGDGSYRAIRVELAKRNLNIRAKPGYWAQ
jgi:VWFA-related protein